MAGAEWSQVLNHLKTPPEQREGWEPFGNPERRRKKMERIDALPPAIKAVVHDFGWLTVKTLMDAGVTDGKQMRTVIKVLLMEHSHEFRSQHTPHRRAAQPNGE